MSQFTEASEQLAKLKENAHPHLSDKLILALKCVSVAHMAGTLLYVGLIIASWKAGILHEVWTISRSQRSRGVYYTVSASYVASIFSARRIPELLDASFYQTLAFVSISGPQSVNSANPFLIQCQYQ